jgi:AcrR family transcriptional regulator
MARPAHAVPPRRRRDFHENREALLRHARRIVAERGPEALTVSEVAHRARLNRTTAYQHFRTRDELLSAVMSAIADEVAEVLARPMPIAEHVDQMVGFFVAHPEIGRLTLHHLLAENPMPRQGFERYVGELERLVRSHPGRDAVDVEMLASVLLSAALLWSLHARVRYDEDELAASTERFTREMKRLLLQAPLRPEQEPGEAAPTRPRKRLSES